MVSLANLSYEYCHLLGYSAVHCVCEPTFRRKVSPPAARWFLARLILDPESWGDTFLRNFGLRIDYTTLYPRAWQYPVALCFPKWDANVVLLLYIIQELSVGRSVSYVTAYGLDVGKGRKFLLCHYIQNGFDIKVALSPACAWGSFSVSGLLGSNVKYVVPYPVASCRMLEFLRARRTPSWRNIQAQGKLCCLARFVVLTALRMKDSFWNVAPCSSVKVSRLFGWICRLRLQYRRAS
jgi:hypothetical protein